MIIQHPLETVTSSVDGDVLAVLARVDTSFTATDLVRAIPRRSRQGIDKSIGRLVEQGVVRVERVGKTRSFRLNREHLAAEPIIALARLKETLIERLRGGVSDIPHLKFAALFGSVARGEMHPKSDIDLFFVVQQGGRSEATDERINDLCAQVTRWTGNDARPLIYEEDGIVHSDPVVKSVDTDGIPLTMHDVRWLARKIMRSAA
jgi:predicted nucleotidyltransferase